MVINKWNLKSRVQSGKSIYRMAKYYKDLGIYLDTDLQTFFNFVRNIPYKEDELNEVTARPKYYLSGVLKALDCKKKMVLMGAWLNAHGVPWSLTAVSERPDQEVHHVFISALIDGKKRSIDPTYNYFTLFEPKPGVTYAEELPR